MKNLIVLIVIVVGLAFVAQEYTDFKAVDLGKEYFVKIQEKISDQDLISWIKNLFQDKNEVKNYKGPDAEKNLNIFIKSGQFLPNKSGVLKNTKVTWYNEDSKPHTVTGENWGSPEIPAGGTYAKKFDMTGTYQYHCTSNPGMTGEIIVQ